MLTKLGFGFLYFESGLEVDSNYQTDHLQGALELIGRLNSSSALTFWKGLFFMLSLATYRHYICAGGTAFPPAQKEYSCSKAFLQKKNDSSQESSALLNQANYLPLA